MPNADWRTPSTYADTLALTNTGYAWEYLRRHEAYRQGFAQVVALPRKAKAESFTFCQKWGLRFRGRSRPARHEGIDVLAPRMAA